MGKKTGTGSGINYPDHISESLKTIFGLKYLNSFFDTDQVSGINIPDQQNCAPPLFFGIPPPKNYVSGSFLLGLYNSNSVLVKMFI
jgi:hypothetical protein